MGDWSVNVPRVLLRLGGFEITLGWESLELRSLSLSLNNRHNGELPQRSNCYPFYKKKRNRGATGISKKASRDVKVVSDERSEKRATGSRASQALVGVWGRSHHVPVRARLADVIAATVKTAPPHRRGANFNKDGAFRMPRSNHASIGSVAAPIKIRYLTSKSIWNSEPDCPLAHGPAHGVCSPAKLYLYEA